MLGVTTPRISLRNRVWGSGSDYKIFLNANVKGWVGITKIGLVMFLLKLQA